MHEVRKVYTYLYQHKCLFGRFYSTQLPKGGIGNMLVLASVMSGEGSGIRDEFLTLYMQAEEVGRGTYQMATKG